MSDYINQLKQLMGLYKDSGMGPPEMTHTGFNPTVFDRSGMAADFAMNAMDRASLNDALSRGMGSGGGQTNFFPNSAVPSYVPPSYTPPVPGAQTVQDIAKRQGFPLAPQDRPQPINVPESSFFNYLVRILGTK